MLRHQIPPTAALKAHLTILAAETFSFATSMVQFCSLLLLLIASNGCTGFHLYRQANHELASKTETAFREAKISESLAGERILMETTAKREQALVRRHALALRNATLKEIIGQSNAAMSWTKLENRINDRISELIGETKADEMRAAQTDLVRFRPVMERASFVFRSLRKPSDPDLPEFCADEQKNQQIRDKLANNRAALDAFNKYITACKDVEAATVRFSAATSGSDSLIGKASSELIAIDQAKKDFAREFATRKAAYENAKAKYNDAARKTNELSQAAMRLSDALENLEVKDADPALAQLKKLGFETLALESLVEKWSAQQESLVAVLGYLGSTNSNAAFPTNTVPSFLVSLLPVLKAEGNKMLQPRISHLLLVEEHLRIQMNQAKRQKEAADARYEFLVLRREYLSRELQLLANAAKWAAVARSESAPPNDKTVDVWIKSLASTTPTTAQAASEALVSYAISWSVGRVHQEEIDYKLIAARHDGALDASEFALQQWDNLIGVPLKQLVRLHGSGIKPETIAQLISAAGIVTAVGAK